MRSANSNAELNQSEVAMSVPRIFSSSDKEVFPLLNKFPLRHSGQPCLIYSTPRILPSLHSDAVLAPRHRLSACSCFTSEAVPVNDGIRLGQEYPQPTYLMSNSCEMKVGLYCFVLAASSSSSPSSMAAVLT